MSAANMAMPNESRVPQGPSPVGEQFKAAGYQVLLALANPVVIGIGVGFAIAKVF